MSDHPMRNNPLYKKAVFQAARRAILENEMITRQFVEERVLGNYDDEKLERLNDTLLRIFDNDLFDIVMGQKKAEAFAGTYDLEILKELETYAEEARQRVIDSYKQK